MTSSFLRVLKSSLNTENQSLRWSKIKNLIVTWMKMGNTCVNLDVGVSYNKTTGREVISDPAPEIIGPIDGTQSELGSSNAKFTQNCN